MMKRVCFISVYNLYLVPYIKNYTLHMSEEDYDVIFWNRENLKYSERNYIDFKTRDNKNRFFRIISYYKFIKFIKLNLRKNKYEKIVFLHTVIPVMMYKFVIKKYRHNYVYDIRDYSYEKYRLFRYIQKKLVKHSACNVISSDGYKHFLPKNEYVITHNYNIHNEKRGTCSLKDIDNGPINISFIGFVRFYNIAKDVIQIFKNDNRFRLMFIGTGSTELEKYINDRNINNVSYIDYFDPSKTLEYYEQCDIVYNLYGYNNPLLDYALSNKLYYSAHLYKPILVFKNTYMEKVSTQFHFGIPVSIEEPNIADYVYNFYYSLNLVELKNGCDRFLDTVINENNVFYNRVNQLLINRKLS